jgi:mono/diheme cytochrome c family protein
MGRRDVREDQQPAVKVWLKRAGIAVGTLVALALVAVAVLNVVSIVRERRTYAVEIAPLSVPGDAATLERGRHLVAAVGGCRDCHGIDLGGQVLEDNFFLGRVVAANLTRGRGGLPSDYTDVDLARAIRHGVRRDGRSVIIMPSQDFQALTDSDLAAIIAYLRTVAPVDRVLSGSSIGPVGRVMHVTGMPVLPAEIVDHGAKPAMPAAGVTAAYGEYLATVGGCRGCHGPGLAGGAGHAPGPNITAGAIGAWTDADFRRALREGRRPDGSPISDDMPWKVFRGMTNDEIAALWLYERSLPPVAQKPK